MATPIRAASTVLAASVRSRCDAVFFEPSASDPRSYTITFERRHETLRTVSVDEAIASATIARLGYLAGLDLAAPSASSAIVHVRSGERQADVVITLRPGKSLRADLMIVPRLGAVSESAPPVTMLFEAGDRIGNYQIVAELGEGGMGTVYAVRHAVLDRQFALKILLPQVFERDPPSALQFVREARAAARIRYLKFITLSLLLVNPRIVHFSPFLLYYGSEILEGFEE